MHFLLALSLIISPPTSDAGDDILRAGDIAYRDFRTRDAIASYLSAYEADRHNYHALVRLARSWADLGRLALWESDSSEVYYRTALRYARELAKHHPDSATSWFMLALCHGSLTPFKSLGEKLDIAQDVEKNALRCLELDSTHSMTHVLLGIYYRGVSRLSWVERTIVNGILGKDIYGTIDDSERHLRKALALDPNNSFAYFELYLTYRAMDRQEKARQALEKVVSCEPTNERELHQQRDARRRLDRMTSTAR